MNMLLAQDNIEARALVHFTVGRIKRSDTRLFLQHAWVVRDAATAVGWGVELLGRNRYLVASYF